MLIVVTHRKRQSGQRDCSGQTHDQTTRKCSSWWRFCVFRFILPKFHCVRKHRLPDLRRCPALPSPARKRHLSVAFAAVVASSGNRRAVRHVTWQAARPIPMKMATGALIARWNLNKPPGRWDWNPARNVDEEVSVFHLSHFVFSYCFFFQRCCFRLVFPVSVIALF